MRKISWIFIMALILGTFFAGNIFAEDGVMKVITIEGKVQIKKAGAEEWIMAKVGDMLYKGDAIKTLEDGLVYLEISTGNGISLAHNSELIVGDAVGGPPLVAEPYSEPAGRESIADVVAPEVNQESAASIV